MIGCGLHLAGLILWSNGKCLWEQ